LCAYSSSAGTTAGQRHILPRTARSPPSTRPACRRPPAATGPAWAKGHLRRELRLLQRFTGRAVPSMAAITGAKGPTSAHLHAGQRAKPRPLSSSHRATLQAHAPQGAPRARARVKGPWQMPRRPPLAPRRQESGPGFTCTA